MGDGGRGGGGGQEIRRYHLNVFAAGGNYSITGKRKAVLNLISLGLQNISK